MTHQVWLPLYPRDEGRPTFLSKRIMLTLNILVYPQGTVKPLNRGHVGDTLKVSLIQRCPSFRSIILTSPDGLHAVVLFRDAILFGLSHETALTEASISASHSFPFATVERTVSFPSHLSLHLLPLSPPQTHVYLHLILRKLLRRKSVY